jgi:hypothetical protein
MLSAIDRNQCPPSIGTAVRLRRNPHFTTLSMKASCSAVKLMLRVGMADFPSDISMVYRLWQSLPMSIGARL